MAPNAVLARDDDDLKRVDRLRWDMVQIQNGVVVPGGTDLARFFLNPSDFLVMFLTGSGQANVHRMTARGGGTFSILNAKGVVPSQLGSGIFYVTGFTSFVNNGGSLAGSVTTDTIGNDRRTTGGVLTLSVKVAGATGGLFDGVLEIHSVLPGGQSDPIGNSVRLLLKTTPLRQFEPIATITLPALVATPDSVVTGTRTWNSGSTLFHVLED
jgi:hypothetical protein